MVSIPMKPNPFKEKITNIRIINQETNQPLGTVNTMDFFPGAISVVAFVDFFNLKPNINYIIQASIVLPDETAHLVNATRVNIPDSLFVSMNKDGYGKSTGNFSFNIALENPTEFIILFTLINHSGETVDFFYTYYEFNRRE